MSNGKKTRDVTPVECATSISLLETLPHALFFVDDAATILYANANAQMMTGTATDEVRGCSLWRCVPQVVSTSLYRAMRRAKRTGVLTEVQYTSSGTQNWLYVHLAPTPEGLMLQFQEVSESVQHPQTFAQSKFPCIDILNGLHGGISFLTPEGIVLDINEIALADAQIQREDVIGKPLAETPWWSFSPACQTQVRAAIARASTGEMVRFEPLVHSREGASLSLEFTIVPQLDADHQIEYLVMAWNNFTVHQQAETDIYALIDAIPQLTWTARPDGSVEYYNQRWLSYTGMSIEQALGDGWMQCTYPDDQERVLAIWLYAVQTGTPFEAELRVRNGATGEYRWFLIQAAPFRDEQGSILKYVGTCTDIEERKRSEQRLKTSEEYWHVLAEALPQFVGITSPDGRFDYINQRWCEYTGATVEQIHDYGWYRFVHPDDVERARALRSRSLETGKPLENEYRLRNGQTGEYRWFLIRALPMHDETGQIVKWFGTCTDIHEKKLAEDEIRAMIDILPQFVWVMRSDGLCEYHNQRWCDYTGITFEQMQGDGWSRSLHPDDRQHTMEVWQHAVQTGEPYEVEQRLRNGATGEYRWFLARAMPLRDGQGKIRKWFGTSTDIDERKQMEEALRQSQERAQALMESNMIGIFVSEGNGGEIVDASDAFLRMTGYNREDLSQHRMNYIHMTPPEYQPISLEMYHKLKNHQSIIPFEKEYICKDGSRLSALVGVVVLTYHLPHQGLAFVLDNSARKELELRKDAFISMASHELKSPLTTLKLQTALLQKQLAKQGFPTGVPAFARMETQLNKITRLVEELLDVSRIQAGGLEYQRVPVDLGVLLQEVVETMQQSSTTHTLLMRGSVQASLPGDRDRLGQVFTNLISNAIKYSPDADIVEIELSSSPETISIRVLDYGLGIPREQIDKIFERFYRATGPQQSAIPGLGMGLYIVAEIVKHHGGTISVDSTMGQGSAFTVTFPRQRDT